MKDPKRRRLTALVDLELLNLLNSEGCAACRRKFTLGETVVMACGSWEGARYVHESEAVWDPDASLFVLRDLPSHE